MIVYRGAGGIVVLFFIVSLFLANIDIFLHYSREKFYLLNWWISSLATGIFTGFWIYFLEKIRQKANPQSFSGKLLRNWGNRHEILFIPLKIWAFIFVGLGTWLLIKQFH